MRKEALLILAEGFEEIEAVTPADVLRRANIHVVLAGLTSKSVKGSRRIVVEADTLLSEYQGQPDVLILPGGVQGADNLRASPLVNEWIRKIQGGGKIIAAICASPAVVLASAGILNGHRATCYPGYEKEWPAAIQYTAQAVAVDGRLITSQGPGTAIDFSLAIVEQICGAAAALDLAGKLVCRK